jgi:hypothetical protein
MRSKEIFIAMLPRLGVRIRQYIPCTGAQVPSAPIRPRAGGLRRRALCSSTESSRQSSQKAYISTYIGLIPVYGMDPRHSPDIRGCTLPVGREISIRLWARRTFDCAFPRLRVFDSCRVMSSACTLKHFEVAVCSTSE